MHLLPPLTFPFPKVPRTLCVVVLHTTAQPELKRMSLYAWVPPSPRVRYRKAVC